MRTVVLNWVKRSILSNVSIFTVKTFSRVRRQLRIQESAGESKRANRTHAGVEQGRISRPCRASKLELLESIPSGGVPLGARLGSSAVVMDRLARVHTVWATEAWRPSVLASCRLSLVPFGCKIANRSPRRGTSALHGCYQSLLTSPSS